MHSGKRQNHSKADYLKVDPQIALLVGKLKISLKSLHLVSPSKGMIIQHFQAQHLNTIQCSSRKHPLPIMKWVAKISWMTKKDTCMTLLLRLENTSLLTGWEQHQHLRSKIKDLLILTRIRVFLISQLFLNHKMTLEISPIQTKFVETTNYPIRMIISLIINREAC